MSNQGEKSDENPPQEEEEVYVDYEEEEEEVPHHHGGHGHNHGGHGDDEEEDEQDGGGGGGAGVHAPKTDDLTHNQWMMQVFQQYLAQQGVSMDNVQIGQYSNFQFGGDGEVEDVTLRCRGCNRLEKLGENFIHCRGCDAVYCCFPCQQENRKKEHAKICPDPVLDWADNKAELVQSVLALDVLPLELINCVVGYCAPKLYNPFPLAFITMPNSGKPSGLTTDGQHLFVCDLYGKCVLQYSTEGKLVDVWDTNPKTKQRLFTGGPRRLDIDKDRLFVVDETTVYILNIKTKELINKWKKPTEYGATGIKIINDYIYLSIWEIHQILVCTLDGEIVDRMGEGDAESETPGSFSQPFGITCDEKFIYACDKGNHRVQTFHKGRNTFISAFGEEGTIPGRFGAPLSVTTANGLLYVGDFMSVQVFTKEGTFIERIGGNRPGRGIDDFSEVYGVTVIGNRLFVGDYNSSRIKIFEELI